MGCLSTTECTYLPTSVAWSKSYISLLTLLTIIPCYTRHLYPSKALEGS